MQKIYLDLTPRITTSDVENLILSGKGKKDSSPLEQFFEVGGGIYQVLYYPLSDSLEIRFSDEAGFHTVKVGLFWSRPGRGGFNDKPLFVCPVTGRRCERLFLVGSVIASRYAFECGYSYKNLSKKQRDVKKALDILDRAIAREAAAPGAAPGQTEEDIKKIKDLFPFVDI